MANDDDESDAGWSSPDLSFTRPASSSDRVWWRSTFGARTPVDVARILARGMPGEKAFAFQIDGLDDSFILDMTGALGNSTIWYHASVLQLREAEFYQDGLNITNSLRGMGYAQRLMGNVADFAHVMNVKRLTLDAQDIGGYMWARAGAVPLGSWMVLRQHIEARADRLLNLRKEIDADDAALIERLAKIGDRNPRVIWALSSLKKQVTSTHRREPGDPARIALGQELLIGSRWRGEIDLADPLSRRMFKRWRHRWRRRGRARAPGKSIHVT